MALEMFNSMLYHGDICMGEVKIYPQREDSNLMSALKEGIRISHFSPPSERCPPLAVLHTIASGGVLFKTEYKEQPQYDKSTIKDLYDTCIKEAKTAVALVGGKELHLVSMSSRSCREPCFWGYNISSGMYNSCLAMLNLRCLAIVFDLDETLIVANTMRTFEDRIENLQRRALAEVDPHKLTVMVAELKRLQEDKLILKQYAESDQVFENGKLIKAESELVPPLSDKAHPIVRPLIRLQERNVILTRINPNIRDTSVLVKLRPAWEDLRSYLTARGRRRFEVYICTMSERDYALEMWRLLDIEARLINPSDLLDRVLCVKSGFKKSLLNVFHDGICHPKMAMVIDDRLKVWDEKDQPRVHVVPAFVPYHAPQAETSNPVPVLCVARNVACNVRGGFFKDFDEGLLQKMADVCFEADVTNLPATPDVSNYLISEEDPNANRDPSVPEGMADSEVERRLRPQDAGAAVQPDTGSSAMDNHDLKSMTCALDQAQPTIIPSSSIQTQPSRSEPLTEQHQEYCHGISAVQPMPAHSAGVLEASVQGSPGREEGEVPESELDPDTRRRLLILQHGQDTGQHISADPSFALRPALQIALPPNQAPGGWLGAEEEMSPRQLTRPSQGLALEPDSMSFDKQRSQQSSFYHGLDNPLAIDRNLHESKRRLLDEGYFGNDRHRHNHMIPDSFSHSEDDESSLNKTSSNFKELHLQPVRAHIPNASNVVGVLQDIALKCGTKVEFRSVLNTTMELEFSVEVLFSGEKVGEGIGRTKREAQHRASEDALKYMASQYISQPGPASGGLGHGHMDPAFHAWGEDEGLRETCSSMGFVGAPKEDDMPVASTSGQSKCMDQRPSEETRRAFNAVDALKEMCTMEGLGLLFQEPPAMEALNTREPCAQVEVAGQILGRGSGPTWEAAKLQAAEEALRNLKSTISQRNQKRSPRPVPVQQNKRVKPTELLRGVPRIPPSPRRYPKNGPPVP